MLLSLDLMFSLLIFASVLVYASLEFEYENKPSVYYYDSSNSLDFLKTEMASKDSGTLNESIYTYLGYKEYYLLLEYYNETDLAQTITIGSKSHKSNYCSRKYYMVNSELIDATLCIWREDE